MALAPRLMSVADIAAALDNLPSADRTGLARLLPESFGAKLRRLARQAEAGNPLTRPPLLKPPVWTPGATYVAGDVVQYPAASVSAAVTVTIASPAVVTWAAHGLLAGTAIRFSTTGTLPTGIAAGVIYFVQSAGLSADSFQIALQRTGGASVVTTGNQSGAHTVATVPGTFVMVSAGGPAGAVPPSVPAGGIAAGTTINDGAGFLWTHIGGVLAAQDDPEAPIVTTTTTQPSGYLPQVIYPAAWPTRFRCYGCAAETYFTTGIRPRTFNIASGQRAARMAQIAFDTDAPIVAICFGNNMPAVSFIVDGRYVRMGGLTVGNGGNTWVVLDWSRGAGRKRRSLVIEGAKDGADLPLLQVNIAGNDSLWAPAAVDDTRPLFIGNSLWSGSNFSPFLPGRDVPHRVGKLLGMNDVWNLSIGGTGYLATNGGTRYTYRERVAEALSLSPDMIFLGDPINDRTLGATMPAITAAAEATLRDIRAGTSAPIIVVGAWPVDDSGQPAGSKNADLEAAVQAAVTAAADPLKRTFFIPLNGGPDGPIITGSWNNTGQTSSTNAGLMLADGTHGVDLSADVYAQRLAKAWREIVLPAL